MVEREQSSPVTETAALLVKYADWIERAYGHLPSDKAPGPPRQLLMEMRADVDHLRGHAPTPADAAIAAALQAQKEAAGAMHDATYLRGWNEGIERAAETLDEAAQDWNRIRDPGMANNARSYAKKIRALSDTSTVSDEDWRRALDCAHSCFPLGKVTRDELDNAMQHGFGMLSLSVSSTDREGK